MDVVLREMGDDDVGTVVAAAVADATPPEVMPPDDEPAVPQEWTPARREAYAAFLRARPATEASFVVLLGGAPVGVARLAEVPEVPGRVETGVWLGRPARGGGVGGAVLELLIERARAGGASELVADTTTGNQAALASLRRAGAVLTDSAEHDGVVDARLAL